MCLRAVFSGPGPPGSTAGRDADRARAGLQGNPRLGWRFLLSLYLHRARGRFVEEELHIAHGQQVCMLYSCEGRATCIQAWRPTLHGHYTLFVQSKALMHAFLHSSPAHPNEGDVNRYIFSWGLRMYLPLPCIRTVFDR